MNEIALRDDQSVCMAQTAQEIRAQVNRIQEVMKAVMKDGVHYGVIPGAGNKPTLYKPGAEKIFSTFRINVDPVIESEARTPEEYTVRVKAIANAGGRELGSAFGEASSNEEKYKWRRAVCDEEFEDTSEDMRRLAYKKYQGKVTRVKQVRVSVPDISNTILKMAVKRAEVALCLQVTAASDVFDQDIEDLPDGLESMIPKPTVKMPTEKQTPKHQAEPTEPDEGIEETTVTFDEIKTQTGKGKKGDWTRYYSKADDGEYYSTFSDTVGQEMQKLEGILVTVAYRIETNAKGTSRTVLAIAATVHQDPQE